MPMLNVGVGNSVLVHISVTARICCFELVHVLAQRCVSGSLDEEVLDMLTQWSTELTGLSCWPALPPTCYNTN